MKFIDVPLNRPFIRKKIFSCNSSSKAMRTVRYQPYFVLFFFVHIVCIIWHRPSHFMLNAFVRIFTQLRRNLSNLLIWIIYSLVRCFLFIAPALRIILVVILLHLFLSAKWMVMRAIFIHQRTTSYFSHCLAINMIIVYPIETIDVLAHSFIHVWM